MATSSRPGHVSRSALLAPGSSLYRRFAEELALGGPEAPEAQHGGGGGGGALDAGGRQPGEEQAAPAQLTWQEVWDAR